MAGALGLGAAEDEEGERLRAKLARLIADPPGCADELLERLGQLDTQIARYARGLRQRFAQVPVSQLRATLPVAARAHRQEVIALVELLLEDDAEVEDHLSALDYLFTLLCFDEGYARRRIVHDPVALSPAIQKACQRRDKILDDSKVAGIELRLFGFADLEADRADVESTIRELREVKRQLGSKILQPRLLRAAVSYNVAVWNRFERFLENERQSDPSWGPSTDAALDSPFESEPGGEALLSRSFLANEAVGAIASTLKRRIEGQVGNKDITERIAMRLDLSMAGEAEIELLRGYDPVTDLEPCAAAVILGLLLAAIPVAADELEEAGLNPRTLQYDWVREVDAELRELARKALAERRFEDAFSISDKRTRFIYEPLLFINKTLRDHHLEPLSPGTPRLPEGPVSQEIRLDRNFRRDILHSMESEWSGRSAPVAGRTQVPPSLAAILCLSILLSVAYHWRSASGESIRELSASELADVSIYLRGGYRDAGGKGSLFVGRLRPSWDKLSREQRRSEAEAMVEALQRERVSQVMIYGERKTLEVQYLKAKLLRPRAT